MIKNIAILISFVFFSNCNNEKSKDYYINNKLPMLHDNLNTSEIDLFKESMELKNDYLISYDVNLLKKGTKDKFDSIVVNIYKEMGKDINDIVVIDSLGKKNKIDSRKFVLKSLNDSTTYILDDFKNEKTVLLIISTTCGSCVSFFDTANKLATNSSIKYVALFTNSEETISNYKNGSVINNFGFLNDSWIKFSNESQIIEKLHLDYSTEKDGYPTLFYIKNNSYHKTSVIQEIEKILTNK